MSKDYSKEFESLLRSVEPEINQYQEKFLSKTKSNFDACIKNFPEDVDRFADCMDKQTKKLSRESKRLEHKLAFINYKIGNCLEKEGNKDFNVCRSLASSLFKTAFEGSLNNI